MPDTGDDRDALMRQLRAEIRAEIRDQLREGAERPERRRERREERHDRRRERREDRREDRRTASPRQDPASVEPGTRERIQRIALQLFTERGYDATSLREIAEQLGVSKAALYYHFKTKEEIISSLVSDHIAPVSELIDWAAAQPRTAQTRAELLHRYAALLQEGSSHEIVALFERNQSSMGHLEAAKIIRERTRQLVGLLADRDANAAKRYRASLAISALHGQGLPPPDASEADRRATALEVALGLIEHS